MKSKLYLFLLLVYFFSCADEKPILEKKQKEEEEKTATRTIESKDGNFRIDIPNEFSNIIIDSTIVMEGKDKQVKTYSLSMELKDKALIVSAAHYSDARFSINSSNEIVEQASGDFLRTLQAQSIRYSPIRFGDFSGVDIHFSTKTNDTLFYGKARVLARRPTIYYLACLSRDSSYFSVKETQHFFGSLYSLH